ncbi:MAG: hypothetical protein KDK89_03895 [Alphaproteobacteria bacterium]|nr:hypothetical protein [Alphaproteobacteria bacterium]
MRAALRAIAMFFAFPVHLAMAWTDLQIAELPGPIREYAEALKPYCEVMGKQDVVVNGIYSDRLYGELDVNGDGLRDYIIYKCMFGCDGEPYALQGLGPGCMFGSLLLSSATGYRSVPVPGQLVSLERAPRLRVAVYRAHINAQDCGGQWYCNYVYELRDDWFRVVGPCPLKGCGALLSALPQYDDRQAAAAPGEGD